MRTPGAVVVAVAAAGAVVVGVPGGATADLTVPGVTATPLPTVSVPLPVDPTVPALPAPTLPDPTVTVPGTGVPGVTGGTGDTGGSGSGGSDGSGSGSPDGPAVVPGSGNDASVPGSASARGAAAGSTPAAGRRERRARAATPMVAGTAAAEDLLDDEHSPQLLAASRDFLAADQGIAEIARQKRLMAQLKQSAVETAATYKALDYDLLTARATSEAMHDRHESIRRQLTENARNAYATGQPTTDDGVTTGLAAALARYSDGSTRADLRVGDLTVRRAWVRADFEQIAARYREAKRRLADANQRLAGLAAQRSGALRAMRAAKASDVALNQARTASAGELGSEIRAASARLDREGTTVRGTGTFVTPLDGRVTSPFGMRMHPILRYTKLHTGTDLAGGSTIVAPDDGRVVMTVTSTAYGLFTVIDHGVIDGKRVTTAYAHQSRFLVQVGQEVRKGDPIGVVGSTGYSTGPHLHFEVREDGAVVDPMSWLVRGR